MVEYGVAKLALPGHEQSGDHHVVRCNRNGVLIAAIDGIGHGEWWSSVTSNFDQLGALF